MYYQVRGSVMEAAIVYSTITGNSKMLADAVYQNIEGCTEPRNIKDVDDTFLNAYDTFIFCYWCRRGTADTTTIDLLEKISGKKIVMLGTLGAYPDSPHGEKLKERVGELVEKSNCLLGNFICQGKIDPARTEKRLKIPKGEPHYLDEEGYKRHLESRKHPDKNDLHNAVAAVKEALWKS